MNTLDSVMLLHCEEKMEIKSITIFTSTRRFALISAHRLHSLHIGVTLKNPGSPTPGTYSLCGQHPGILDPYTVITCSYHIRGRYVIVQIASQLGILTLCEVEVYQTLSTGLLKYLHYKQMERMSYHIT